MLILDNATRWNSTYRMIDHGLQLKELLNSFLAAELAYPKTVVTKYGVFSISQICEDEWVELEFLHKFLSIFNVFTKFIERNKFPTLGYTISKSRYTIGCFQQLILLCGNYLQDSTVDEKLMLNIHNCRIKLQKYYQKNQ